MGAFDKIIGYDAIKKKLERTAGVLANTEAYAKLGARPPRALLLYGETKARLTTFCLTGPFSPATSSQHPKPST